MISQPGSYYLGEDITAIPDNNAITITADDVSLDLNGFTVRGNLEVTDGHGIAVSGDHVTIRNGNVKFADGDGIHCQSAAYLTLIDVNSVSNGGFGVLCSQMHILNGAFSKNGKSGVNGSSVQTAGVNASENTSHGFFLGNPAMVSRFIVLGNGGDGVRCAGLSGVVMQTVATFNTGANWVDCTVIDSYAP